MRSTVRQVRRRSQALARGDGLGWAAMRAGLNWDTAGRRDRKPGRPTGRRPSPLVGRGKGRAEAEQTQNSNPQPRAEDLVRLDVS